MAKVIEYDVQGVEEGGGGTGVKVPVGVHPCRIALAEAREKKADGSPANDIRVGLDFGPEYDWIFTYIGLGPESDWKLAEFVRALNLKDKGKLNLETIVKNKTVIRCKVNPGTYNGEPSPEAGRLMKAQPGDKIGEKISEVAAAAAEAGDEPTGDEPGGEKTYANPDFVPSREGEEGVGDYDTWPDEDLLAECEDRGIALAGGRGSKKDKAIAALRAEDEEVAGGGAAEPEAATEATPDAEADDYDEWELDRLKQEWEDRQMGELPAIRGRGAADRLKAAIIEELRKDDAENPFEG